jgi:hypothetical protein
MRSKLRRTLATISPEKMLHVCCIFYDFRGHQAAPPPGLIRQEFDIAYKLKPASLDYHDEQRFDSSAKQVTVVHLLVL